MKRIPKAFQFGPHRIEVRVVSEEEMFEQDGGAHSTSPETAPLGLCDFLAGVIYVQKVSKTCPKRVQMHAFWHEYFHMLFHYTGRERLSRDETLVDNCGALQLQAFQTAEY